jgi:hypothetical protein
MKSARWGDVANAQHRCFICDSAKQQKVLFYSEAKRGIPPNVDLPDKEWRETWEKQRNPFEDKERGLIIREPEKSQAWTGMFPDEFDEKVETMRNQKADHTVGVADMAETSCRVID